jgi:hypothetical protein
VSPEVVGGGGGAVSEALFDAAQALERGKVLFDTIDTDKSGVIGMEEFGEALRDLGGF